MATATDRLSAPRAAPRLRDHFPPERFGQRPILILDGGMGSTLEAEPFGIKLESELWSSELLKTVKGRETIRKLHEGWVENGAEIIASCSYQASLSLFLGKKPFYNQRDEAEALRILQSSLPLVTTPFTPSTQFNTRQPPTPVLSLGPFGAQCKPGEEYTGRYPPPFGPYQKIETAFTKEANRMISLPHDRIGLSFDPYEDSLAAWHLARIEHFAQSPEFKKLGFIMFETIPLLREARAIRRAMGSFRISQPNLAKPFVISLVFTVSPEGHATFPDPHLRGKTGEERAKEIVRALVDEADGLGKSRSDGVGINCLDPRLASSVIEELSNAWGKIDLPWQPWLVLYPNGGAQYDPISRCWSEDPSMTQGQWATTVLEALSTGLSATTDLPSTAKSKADFVFEGAIVGGCCQVGFEGIRVLRMKVDELGLLGAGARKDGVEEEEEEEVEGKGKGKVES